ncbi:MAG: metallophosphoesterase [Terriglobia bacterium]
MRRRFAIFIVLIQSILFLAHWVVYETVAGFLVRADPPAISPLAVAFALASVSFVTASVLAFRYSHWAVRVFYTICATWLGILSLCFFASGACWILYALSRLLGMHWDGRALAAILLSSAVAASLYGIINAARIRVNRITLTLPNLPDSWIGRTAALVSDTHLGHVRGYGFIRRILKVLTALKPDVVFIGGDLYDGTAADIDRLAEPWSRFSAPLGAFFVCGNHEEFSDSRKYIRAVEQRGIRVLNNEKVSVDGLQIVGVHHRDSAHAERFKSILQAAGLDRDRASILLTHAPYHLAAVEQEGISLQLSGHTHGGQFFPFTWITSRIYGKFVYGLNRLTTLMVYTSSGAGTWGPPLRVGTRPEIVLFQFER